MNRGSLDVDKTVQAAEGWRSWHSSCFAAARPSGDMGCCAMKRAVGRDWATFAGRDAAACGLWRQAGKGAAASVLQVQSGSQSQSAHSGDLSTQFFSRAAGRCHGVVQCTIGMEGCCGSAAQAGGRPDRAGEPVSAGEYKSCAKEAAGRPAGEERLCIGRLDSLRRFALCVVQMPAVSRR